METVETVSEHHNSGVFPHIDPGAAWSLTPELAEIAEIEPCMMAELLVMFIDDSATRLTTLANACASQDFKVVRAEAHSLKGSALQIGAPRLGSVLAELEHAERPNPDECRRMMSEIGDAFALVRKSIDRYLGNIVPGESETRLFDSV